VLENAVGYFPPRSVHLAVVDPGVGGERRAIVIETERFLLVGPDNGLLSLAAERSPRRRVVHLDRPSWFRESAARTFHGRDVFAPVAAHLAAGTPAAELGSEIEDYERVVLPVPRSIDGAVEGQVIHVDRFGNLVSNLRQEDLAAFRDSELSVSIAGVRIRGIVSHYAAVREGGALALWNSWGRLEVAVRNGSAARHLRAHPGDRVEVRRASAS
jgi:S-adenosylmethionine hydrolase